MTNWIDIDKYVMSMMLKEGVTEKLYIITCINKYRLLENQLHTIPRIITQLSYNKITIIQTNATQNNTCEKNE